MAQGSTQADVAKSGNEGKDSVRNKALKRLAAAAIITITALAGLWWLDQSGKKQPTQKPPAPTPIITAPSPIITTPEPPLAEAPLVEEAPLPEEPQNAPTEHLNKKQAPPPPKVGQATGQLTRPLQAQQPGPESTRPALRPAAITPNAATKATVYPPSVPPSAAKTAGKPILAEAPPPAGRGYVVQLGVFTNPKNAQELVQKLQSLGIRSYTETRVHVGPFLNQSEAEKAQLELQRNNIKGVVAATK